MNVGRPAQHCVLLRADEEIEKQAAAMVASVRTRAFRDEVEVANLQLCNLYTPTREVGDRWRQVATKRPPYRRLPVSPVY